MSGTCPEAIKLAPVIRAFQQAENFRTRVVLTGQHPEMVSQVMGLFGLEADHELALMAPKQTLAHITCGVLQGLKEFSAQRPDLVLVQGDITTAFASTLATFYEQVALGLRGGGPPPPDLSATRRLNVAGSSHARCLPGAPSHSGGIQREGPSIGKPMQVQRRTTERPEVVEAGSARLIGTDNGDNVGGAGQVLDEATTIDATVGSPNPHGGGQASKTIGGKNSELRIQG